jgi:hypothetical protein
MTVYNTNNVRKFINEYAMWKYNSNDYLVIKSIYFDMKHQSENYREVKNIIIYKDNIENNEIMFGLKHPDEIIRKAYEYISKGYLC